MSLAGFYKDKTLLADVLDALESYVDRVRAAFGWAHQNLTVFTLEDAPIDVLLQTVDLNVTTLSSARRAVALLLPRLSPLDPDLVEWDLAGPQERIGERTRFVLAIVRRVDLEGWSRSNPEQSDLNIHTDQESKFAFRSTLARISKRQTVIKWGLAMIAAYTALWFALASWAERPSTISDEWLAESVEARQLVGVDREKTDTIISEIDLISSYQNGFTGKQSLSVLADISTTLSNDAWLQEFAAQKNNIRLTGYMKTPSKLAANLEANKFVDRVELGAVSLDRATGLNRFSLTLVLRPENRLNGAADE